LLPSASSVKGTQSDFDAAVADALTGAPAAALEGMTFEGGFTLGTTEGGGLSATGTLDGAGVGSLIAGGVGRGSGAEAIGAV
jgi:hypothetical protein